MLARGTRHARARSQTARSPVATLSAASDLSSRDWRREGPRSAAAWSIFHRETFPCGCRRLCARDASVILAVPEESRGLRRVLPRRRSPRPWRFFLAASLALARAEILPRKHEQAVGAARSLGGIRQSSVVAKSPDGVCGSRKALIRDASEGRVGLREGRRSGSLSLLSAWPLHAKVETPTRSLSHTRTSAAIAEALLLIVLRSRVTARSDGEPAVQARWV